MYEFLPAKISSEKIDFSLYAYGKKGSHLEVGCFHDFTSTNLSFLFAADIHHWVLLRAGEIKTFQQIDDLIECFEIISQEKPLHLSLSNLSMAEEFWGNISSTHAIVARINAEKNANVAFFNFPLLPLFISPAEERRLPQTLKSLRLLSIHINSEGWEQYFIWIKQKVKNTLQGLNLEATDEFRLEAVLQDLVHEIESEFSRQLIKKTRSHALIDSQVEERTRVETRIELLKHVQTVLDKIEQCLFNIEIVKEIHPDLSTLNINLKLLKEILSIQLNYETSELQTEPQLFIMLEIFNELNGIVHCTTSETGLDQNNLAFALRLAAIQIQHFFPLIEVIDTLGKWNQNIAQINLDITGKRKLDKHGKIVVKLRELIYQNFIQINQILQSFSVQTTQNQLSQLKPNTAFLNFFPAEFCPTTEQWKSYPLVVYDSDGKPQGFSYEGLKWLEKNL